AFPAVGQRKKLARPPETPATKYTRQPADIPASLRRMPAVAVVEKRFSGLTFLVPFCVKTKRNARAAAHSHSPKP
ncbi:hypothetical protein, partial [Thermaurantimonas aggregans]|uniref:hypothetical protein n=1 Tax=Thermaurantimonas aggregans TaxID=2173829 RepID=UPI001C3F9F76